MLEIIKRGWNWVFQYCDIEPKTPTLIIIIKGEITDK